MSDCYYRGHKWGRTATTRCGTQTPVCVKCGMSRQWHLVRRDFTTATRHELTALRERNRQLREALENCQNILAYLIDPQNKGSGIDHMGAWARCVEAEKSARTALSRTGEE